MRRSPLTLLAVTVVSASLAGCGHFSPNAPSGSTGTLTGILEAVSGPYHAGTVPRGLSGQVTLHGSKGQKTGITVGANGRFSVPVPVGTYTVTARSPQYQDGAADCRPSGPVVVTKGATTRVEIDCQER